MTDPTTRPKPPMRTVCERFGGYDHHYEPDVPDRTTEDGKTFRVFRCPCGDSYGTQMFPGGDVPAYDVNDALKDVFILDTTPRPWKPIGSITVERPRTPADQPLIDALTAMDLPADPPNVSYGDRDVALAGEILRTVVGSEVHGINIPGSDDHDEMGVFIEPRDLVYGVTEDTADPNAQPGMDHHVWRTKPEGERSGHGDTDLVIYSLRRYLRLCIKGHPTVLLPLFAPESQVLLSNRLGDVLRESRTLFLSQDSVHRFIGYMARQRQLMMGAGPQGKLPNRPELVDAYGYDTKYASHALRLALQGYEVATTGHLTLPMPDGDRERVLAIKRGDVTQQDALDQIADVGDELRAFMAAGSCQLPSRPYLPVISKLSIELHEAAWFHGRHQ